MRLDRAIEILERKVASPFVRANKESLEATRLGIEALKRVDNERIGLHERDIQLLHGETKS